MTHYAEYKVSEPAVLRELVGTYPFATIMANGSEGPITAQAPLTFRDGPKPAGAIEFHLALANPITETLAPDVAVTVMVQGPRAAISPSWFAASFPTPEADAAEPRRPTIMSVSF